MNAWALRLKNYSTSQTGRLALTYLAIIMVMTIVFSVIIYSIASAQFDRPLPPQFGARAGSLAREQFEQLFTERAEEARARLLFALAILLSFILFIGALISHFLARKTLQPIEEAMEVQYQFISDASHELRTPLTALQLTNEVALRRKTLSIEEARTVLEHTVIETGKLTALSNSLLGLVAQDTADIKKTNQELGPIISEAVATVAHRADKKKITISSDIPVIIATINEAAVAQVLTILLENAIKYSLGASTVTVSVSQNAKKTFISVTDQGIGISEHDLKHVFDRFYRADSSRSKIHEEGTGLGLAIAKAICERHDMSLSVKSRLEKGSTFTLSL